MLKIKEETLDKIIEDLQNNPENWEYNSLNCISSFKNGYLFKIEWNYEKIKTLGNDEISIKVFDPIIIHIGDYEVKLNLHERKTFMLANALARLAYTIYEERFMEKEKIDQARLNEICKIWK